MELKIGEYFIPDGCSVIKVGRTIKVYPSMSKKKEGSDRCRRCIHFAIGNTKYGHAKTWVCDLKPKSVKHTPPEGYEGQHLYYAAKYYDMPCENYVRREDK